MSDTLVNIHSGAPAASRTVLAESQDAGSTSQPWYAQLAPGGEQVDVERVFCFKTDAGRATGHVHTQPEAVDAGISRFHDDIDRLCRLEANWNGYGSEAPNALAAAHACWILDGLYSHAREPDRVVASAENGIGVYITRGTKYAIIECFNDGEIVAGLSDRRGNIQNLDVPAERREIMRSLEEILANLDA